jgi:hypothetical protein
MVGRGAAYREHGGCIPATNIRHNVFKLAELIAADQVTEAIISFNVKVRCIGNPRAEAITLFQGRR